MSAKNILDNVAVSGGFKVFIEYGKCNTKNLGLLVGQ
jgi:hypothetical protein